MNQKMLAAVLYGREDVRVETVGVPAIGSNDVLVVKGDKEHAIPYLRGSVILDINLDKSEMHVDWELI